jgi:hypothetical protein
MEDDRATVAALIDDLRRRGALRARQGSLGEMLGISEEGIRLLAGRSA